MRRSVSSSIVLACCIVLGSSAPGCSQGSTDDDTARSLKQAIAQGILDSGETKPFVGALQTWPNGTSRCSAVLITPTYVLTANHCITDNGADISPGMIELDVAFAFDPTTVGAPNPRVGVHTKKSSGNILVRFPHISGVNGNDSAHDLAIIPLDLPISPNVIQAVPPAGVGGVPQCSDPITIGDGIGYGGLNLIEGGPGGKRSYGNGAGYHTQDFDQTWFSWFGVKQFFNPGNLVYINKWGPFGLGYSGVLKGDSGGSLIDRAQQPRVCGIASRYYGPFPPFGDVFSEYAAVDSVEGAQFVGNAVLDKYGRFKGQCYGPAVDSDGDGFFDSCDNCPNIQNDQRDRDGDGVGDRCDDCKDVKNPRFGSPSWNPAKPNQPDVNFDAEQLAMGNGSRVLPVTPVADDYLTKNFPGDVCDPDPVTVLTPTGLDYPGPRTISCLVVPTGAFCPANAKPHQETCSLAHENVMQASSFVGGTGMQGGLTRVFSCQCGLANPIDCETMAGCGRWNGGTSFGDDWRVMTIDDAQTKARLTVTGEGLVRTLHPDLQISAAATGSWGWAYWQDMLLPAPAPKPTTSIFVGLAWSWVKAVQPGSVSPALNAPPTGTLSDLWRRQIVTRLEVNEAGSAVVDEFCPAPFNIIRLSFFEDCPNCLGGAFLKSLLTNPTSPTIVAPGFAERPAGSLVDAVVASAVVDSNLKVVLAGDSPGWSTGPYAGAIVDLSTSSVATALRDGPDGIVAEGSPTVGGLLKQQQARPAVFVASRRRQQLAFFDDRDANGVLIQGARVHDLELRTSTIKRYLGKWTLQSPVAATYRADDDSYYVLDDARVANKRVLRLYQVGLGWAPALVAEWPRLGAFDQLEITAGADGSLVVSASNAAAHAIAVLAVVPNGVALRAVYFGPDPIAIAAYANHNGITYVARQKDGVLEPRVQPSKPSSVKDKVGLLPLGELDNSL